MHGFKRIGDEETDKINNDRKTDDRGSFASGDEELLFAAVFSDSGSCDGV